MAIFLVAPVNAAALSVEQLGTLGGVYSRTVRVNNANQVCGVSLNADSYDRAFLYAAGTMRDLGTLGGKHSAAVDMNDAGQVVGWANTPTCHMEIFAGQPVCAPDYHAFLHDGETMIDLGTLGGPVSEATAVNESGQVVGYSGHAFLYSGGVMTDLGTLGGNSSYATDINDAGEVVGSSTLAGGQIRPFLYSNGTMTDLGTLGETSYATSINAAGDVVGVFWTSGGEYHAFLYRDGTMIDLGEIAQEPILLNEAGQVLLPRHTDEVHSRPVLYEDGVYTDIGDAVDRMQALNSSGEAAGWSSTVMGNNALRYSDGVMTPLSSFDDGDAFGKSLNDFGRVAGDLIVDGYEQAVLFSHACKPEPLSGCVAAPKASFQMKRTDDPAKSRLSWSWSSGAALLAEDLGQPNATTAYELCVYDSVGGEDVLVADLALMPNALWRDGGTSRTYKDSAGSRDGVRSLQVRSGAEGETRVRLKAKGASVPLPAPVEADKFLHQDSRVTVQLVADTTGVCWTSEFTDPASNDGDTFKASAP